SSRRPRRPVPARVGFRTLVEFLLRMVSLGRRLDVHEGDGGADSSTASSARVLLLATASSAGAAAPPEQLDALNSSIPGDKDTGGTKCIAQARRKKMHDVLKPAFIPNHGHKSERTLGGGVPIGIARDGNRVTDVIYCPRSIDEKTPFHCTDAKYYENSYINGTFSRKASQVPSNLEFLRVISKGSRFQKRKTFETLLDEAFGRVIPCTRRFPKIYWRGVNYNNMNNAIQNFLLSVRTECSQKYHNPAYLCEVRHLRKNKKNRTKGDLLARDYYITLCSFRDAMRRVPEIFVSVMTNSGCCYQIYVNGEEDIRLVPAERQGPYIVCLTGLSGGIKNLKCSLELGSIFSIYKRDPKLTSYCSKTANLSYKYLVSAGYALYSTSTKLVMSTGTRLLSFVLDPVVQEFILHDDNIRIPDKGTQISVHEGHSGLWEPQILEYMKRKKDPKQGKPLKARYVGCLVADFHRTLYLGGIYLYPANRKYPQGKTTLLCECIPLAHIAHLAGGTASTGRIDVLKMEPDQLGQFIPFFVGSKKEVEELLLITSTPSRAIQIKIPSPPWKYPFNPRVLKMSKFFFVVGRQLGIPTSWSMKCYTHAPGTNPGAPGMHRLAVGQTVYDVGERKDDLVTTQGVANGAIQEDRGNVDSIDTTGEIILTVLSNFLANCGTS
ncbi:unnamed protein product, partial [Nesidiocoris tenuis]